MGWWHCGAMVYGYRGDTKVYSTYVCFRSIPGDRLVRKGIMNLHNRRSALLPPDVIQL